MSRKIPGRNSSPYGWWTATVIERFVYDDEDVTNPLRRSTAWENTVMVKARDRNHAYRKVIEYTNRSEAEFTDDKSGRRFRVVFQGLSDLLPVYDEIDEDGFEVSFTKYEKITVRRIESWLREKHELQAFDDEVE